MNSRKASSQTGPCIFKSRTKLPFIHAPARFGSLIGRGAILGIRSAPPSLHPQNLYNKLHNFNLRYPLRNYASQISVVMADKPTRRLSKCPQCSSRTKQIITNPTTRQASNIVRPSLSPPYLSEMQSFPIDHLQRLRHPREIPSRDMELRLHVPPPPPPPPFSLSPFFPLPLLLH